jgi:hypothetical protein
MDFDFNFHFLYEKSSGDPRIDTGNENNEREKNINVCKRTQDWSIISLKTFTFKKLRCPKSLKALTIQIKSNYVRFF